ncbi:hypothetical protein Rs2_21322 [Raphanus sativus]|nr:hypothetical protein Rs2_21322 [Raphanus sativus]
MSLLDWGKAEIRFRLIHVSEARNTTEVGVLIGLGLLLIYEQVGTWCREEPLKDEIRAKRRCSCGGAHSVVFTREVGAFHNLALEEDGRQLAQPLIISQSKASTISISNQYVLDPHQE